jgi:hypothetical protein
VQTKHIFKEYQVTILNQPELTFISLVRSSFLFSRTPNLQLRPVFVVQSGSVAVFFQPCEPDFKTLVKEENIHGDDVIITIYKPVPDYVVGRSTSRH